jgi:hypothetical protein
LEELTRDRRVGRRIARDHATDPRAMHDGIHGHARHLTGEIDDEASVLELLMEPAHRFPVRLLKGAEGKLYLDDALEEILAATGRRHRDAVACCTEARAVAIADARDLGRRRIVAAGHQHGREHYEPPGPPHVPSED